MSQQKFNPMSGQFDLVNQSSLISDPDPTLSADLNLDGNSIVTNAGQDLPLSPGAGGNVVIDENKWPTTDGVVGQVIKTDGAGNLYWAADDAGLSAASNLETQQATLTTKAVTPASLNAVTAALKDTGFVSWGGSGVYYSVAGTNFTLKRPGTGYIQSKRVDWLGNQTISSLLPGATYYVFINSSGNIGSLTTATQASYENYIILFEVWVDAASVVTVVKENHPYAFPADASNYMHRVIGTVIQNSAGGANIAIQGTKALQIVGTDVLEDHGLETTIPDSSGNAVTINWCYVNGAGKWVRYLSQTTTPSVYNAAGTPTALTAGRFGVWRIYVSKDDLNSSTPTYYAVMHTAQFTNLALARTAIINGVAAATNELASLELAQLGYIIFSQASDSIVEVQIQKAVLRGTITGAGASNLASLISTDTTNFNGALSASDTNVQTALETLDDAAYTIVTYISASGNHTFNSRTKWIDLTLYSSGNGGGSGRRGQAGTDRYGGGGGSGGPVAHYRIRKDQIPATITITVGAGGLGGAAQTNDDKDGNDGQQSNRTNIDTNIYSPSNSTGTGKKGTATTGTAGSVGSSYFNNGMLSTPTMPSQTPRPGSNGTAVASASIVHLNFGGGGGGGLNTTDVVGNGGAGSACTKLDGTNLIVGGLAGIAGASGGNGIDILTGVSYSNAGGMGGGGGGASKTAAAGAGGKGGWPGGGGGGGGASLNGFNSGKGGDGGDGGVIIIEYL